MNFSYLFIVFVILLAFILVNSSTTQENTETRPSQTSDSPSDTLETADADPSSSSSLSTSSAVPSSPTDVTASIAPDLPSDKSSTDSVPVVLSNAASGGSSSPQVSTPASILSEADLEEIRKLMERAEDLREQAQDSDELIQECIALYVLASQKGNCNASNALGEIYMYGEGGLAPNYTQAMHYFNRSAAVGCAHAQHNLATMYSLGLHGEQSDAIALLYDYFAAMGGSNKAKMSLGYRHLYGLGVPQSCESAVLYYSQVAEDVVKDLTARPVATVIERARLADERSRTQSLEEDEDVIQYYQQSAENGDVGAQVALGHLHFYGARGVEHNAERAARYFRAAAGQGEPNAMSSLGQMHIQGIGVDKDNDTAFKYFSQAAQMNNAAAQNGLGFMYLHGYGTKQDHKMALRYFKQAAEQGSAEAQYHLGGMYFGGVGVEKKYTTALQYFQSAAHQGHTRALFNLGQMHLDGLGTIRSCSTGIKLIKTVAERGPWATVLGTAHRQFLKGNLETALMQYAGAAEEGYEVAQSNSAWMFDHSMGYNAQNRPELALRHFVLASDQGNIDALRMIGDYAFYGFVDQPDYPKAAKYYTQATQGASRNAQAMFNLGWMHEYGIGLPRDFHLAKRFYDQAIETDPEAYVPARLALTGLWLHRKYEEWSAWWEGRPVSASTNITPQPATPTPPASTAKSTIDSKTSKHSGGPSKPWWLEEWPLEDIILLILCGAFAVCVYVLSQRRL